jgi:hypothetical protein
VGAEHDHSAERSHAYRRQLLGCSGRSVHGRATWAEFVAFATCQPFRPIVGDSATAPADREAYELYVCWSTNGSAHHDRHKAHQALVDAGYSPDIVKARGQEHLPKSLQFRFRREVHALTGSFFVPVLVLDDGSALNEPDEIVTWAKAHAAAYETASFDSRRGTGLNRWSQRCLLVVGRVVGPQHRLVSSIRGSCVGGR